MSEHDNEEAEKDSITLSSFDIAKLTGGDWEGLNAVTSFSGVSVGEAEASAGELYVALDKESWSSSRLASLQVAGVRGVVVQREAKIIPQALPLLRVDDPKDALRIIAEENARRAKAKRILVTGTEGKTGLKNMLHHIIRQQMPCHAILNSSNLHVPIWRSMASIRREDEIAIIEISVANPNRGWQRSNIVRPHICVITNISPQHTALHGSMERLIRHKAESVTALQPGGVCIINADNEYFLELKDAIQRIKPVPVLTFGSSPFCEGQLINATFIPGKSGWQVQARIFGKSVNYFISMVNSYAPLASVSALTIAAHLGLDLSQATACLGSFSPFETAGRIVNLPVKGGEFTLFDHSLRGSLAGFRSAFDDLYRVSGTRKARLVLGAILDLGEHERESIHRQLATLINLDLTEKIYTVGDEMRIVREAISDKSKLGPHGSTPEEIAEELFNDIQPGDVVFIKGHHRVWLSRLVETMESRSPAGDGEQQVEPSHGMATRTDESAGAVVPTPEPVYTLIAGGDVMLSRDLPGLVASAGIESPFREVRPFFARSDIALVNLECVLSGSGDFFDKGEGRPYYYRCPPNMVDVLVAAGISAVTTANNHVMDFGPDALADQSRILAETGIANAGSGANAEHAMQPMFIRVGKLVVAILSFATEQPRHAAGANNWGIFQTGFDKGTVDRMKVAIAAAREGADLVIASPHWGENWVDQPTEEIRRLGWSLIDLGADAVLGHSAHILQGIEVYRGKPIVYDMGTLLFDRVQQSRMRHSALFELGFGGNGIERLVIHPVELEPGSVRFANEEESSRTTQLIEEWSCRLDPAVEFRVVGKALELRLEPSGITPRKQDPEKIFDKSDIRSLKPGDGSYYEANIFRKTPPAGIDPGSYIDLGGGVRVLGARFPEQVRAGFGFVLEVYFQCLDMRGRRWRASLLGIDSKTGKDFRYRHPVAEGMWVPQNWHDERIINDRIVVRPPEKLASGKYDLYWNLVNADTGLLRKIVTEHPQIRDDWLFIGSINITQDAPRVVAGMSSADAVPIRPFSELSARKSEAIQFQPADNEKSIEPPALAGLSHPEKPGGLANQVATPMQALSPEENSMEGLRRLSLEDLPRYKAAFEKERRLAWQHYFPFLYLFSVTAKSEYILISEEGGSLCVYRRDITADGPKLQLASLPMPMNLAVLEGCLARIREHNQSRVAAICWVDEEDMDTLNGLGGISATAYEPDYLFDPKIYKSLSGGKTSNLRKNLSRFLAQNDIELRTYTQGDMADCLALLDEWAELQKDKHDKIFYQRYTRDCLKFADQFEARDLFGKVVLIDGKIRSFGFGGEMRPGLGNLLVAYSDHRIKGLNYFLKTQLMLEMEGCDMVNGGRADTPGLKYAKDSFCPVAMHNVYRVKIEPAAPARALSPQEKAMVGLRRISLDDLPRYKAAFEKERRLAWQHYFPFLYLFSVTAKSEYILISEEGGSLCVYRRNITANGATLYLASLPMPMNTAVLEGCLARIREHNQSQDASIYWVDEEDLSRLNGMGFITASPYNPHYLFAPKTYQSLSGSKTSNLRKNLSYMRARNDVEMRAYTPDDMADCLALLDEWAELQNDKHDKILNQRYTRDCLQFANQFEEKDLFGRVVLIDGKIRSFGFGGEMRTGLSNLFLAYSDHRIKGLNYFLKTQLMLEMEGSELVNDGRAGTPGLKYAKDSLCPVAMHNVYRVKIEPVTHVMNRNSPDGNSVAGKSSADTVPDNPVSEPSQIAAPARMSEPEENTP